MSYTKMERIARPGEAATLNRGLRVYQRGGQAMAIVTGGGGRGRDASLRSHDRGEIFPGLEVFIWVGSCWGYCRRSWPPGCKGVSMGAC